MTTVLIQDVYMITGVGVVAVGQVKSGILRPGMKTDISGRVIEIKSIGMKHQSMKEAKEGDNIGMAVRLISGATEKKGFLGKIIGGGSSEERSLLNSSRGKHLEFV